MKKLTIYRYFSFLALSLVLFTSCGENNSSKSSSSKFSRSWLSQEDGDLTQAQKDAMLNQAIDNLRISQADFDAHAVKAYVFKNPNPIGNEAMLITRDNEPVKIVKVSTGKEGAIVGGGDETLATPNGRFEFIDYNFHNLSTPNFNPSNAVVFISIDVGQPLNVEFAVHDSAQVTGEPASHGCVRSNGADDLKAILNTRGGATSGAVHVIDDSATAESVLRSYGLNTEEDIRAIYSRD